MRRAPVQVNVVANRRREHVIRTAVATLIIALAGPLSAQERAPLDQQIAQVESQVLTWRRHIHQYPELGYQEHKTAAYIADALRKMPGVEVETGLAGTGVKAVLKGGQPGRVVALRADMDALPVEEKNDLPYRSRETATVSGKTVPVMHACGHDTHVAMLLGAASVLSQSRASLKGTVVFIFQPAEEGGAGAFKMVKAGVLDNPKVDAVFGQHIGAGFPAGSLNFRSGGTMASADTFSVKVQGKGGHGSAPWAAKDPILAASQMIVALQTAVARDTDMTKGGTSFTVGTIAGGTRRNVIPEEASFAGTIRTLSQANRETMRQSLQRIVQGTAQAHGLSAEIEYEQLYPVTENDDALTRASVGALRKAAGDAAVKEIPPRMGSEDFGAYGQNIPAFFWFLNASPFPDKAGAPNHSPQFTIDERALKVGVGALVYTAVDYLNGPAL
ncbi:MAG: amidohydrolase [Variovorax paradoxus]|nr:MAG: amidohydrolase [Variovorax paradoxus]PZQ00391.1 MAG: amidohydrolase [Variovorax paradoxus]